jgi:hypothetical protein
MSAMAEHKLNNTFYRGEQRNWNFEKFVKIMVDQHAILESLTRHGYAGIDERSKVCHLLNGVKSSALNTVKTRIMSDADLRNDFNAAVNLFQDFIHQDKSLQSRDAHISAVNVNDKKNNGKDPNIEADMSVPDRYYTLAEYKKLTAAQKMGLKIKREKRGHDTKKGGKKRSNSEINISKASIKAIASAVQQDNDTGESSSDQDAQVEAPKAKKQHAGSNRKNKALMRKQT